MKKSLYISAIAFLLAGGMLSSCSDFLDSDNKTTGNIDADGVLSGEPQSLLYSAYNSLYAISTEVAINEEGTDLYIPVRGKAASSFDQYTLNAEDKDVYTYWKNLYGMINYANGVIYYNTAGTSTYNEEAKFIRCYGYYLLTQQFGKVPYVTDYISSSKPGYPRTEVADIYDGCIKELEEVYNAQKLKEVSSRGTSVASPTQEAVALLIAKFYLAKGWDCDINTSGQNVAPNSDSDNFDNAAEWADKAINSKRLNLTFAEKWNPSNDNNAESLWAIQPDRTNTVGAHSLQNDYGNYYGECTATGYKNSSSTHAQSEKSLYLFAEGDARYEATFMTTILNKGADGWGKTGYYAAYNNKKWKKVGYRYFPYYVSTSTAESTFNADLYSYSASDGNNENVQAFILGNPDGGSNCTAYTFNPDGSINEVTTKTYSDLSLQVAGGVCVKKFDDAASTQVTKDDDYRAIEVFGLGDAYLTAAEAYYMSGDADKALEYINDVRKRAYGDDSGKLNALDAESYSSFYIYKAPAGGFQPIDIILDERARELYAERTRWIDLRRTKQLARYNSAYNPNLGNNTVKTLRPIPANEISANSDISDQNPGY